MVSWLRQLHEIRFVPLKLLLSFGTVVDNVHS